MNWYCGFPGIVVEVHTVKADEQKNLRSHLKLRLLENYEEARKAAASGAQPNLNLNKVRAIGILVPDKEEQTEIVRQVDQPFAHAARVNNALTRVKLYLGAVAAIRHKPSI